MEREKIRSHPALILHDMNQIVVDTYIIEGYSGKSKRNSFIDNTYTYVLDVNVFLR